MLFRYLSRLYDTIHSRGDVEIEHFEIRRISRLKGFVAGRLLFYDQYLRIWDLECRRKPAPSLVKADWRPHSSQFPQPLIIMRNSCSRVASPPPGRGEDAPFERLFSGTYDGSFLEFEEDVELKGKREIDKVYYKYHYQKGDRRIFRYDNALHYPDLPSFPHHKHVGDKVKPADPPDLSEVLREIDGHLYGRESR